MKNIIRITALLTILVMLALVFAGCAGEGNNEIISSPTDGYTPRPLEPAELTLEQMEEIEDEYSRKYDKNYREPFVCGYYGTYNGNVALLIVVRGEAPKVTRYVTVGDCEFKYLYEYDILIFKDGDFITLSEAYEQGIITHQDLKNIHYYYTEDLPRPKNPEKLSNSKIRKLLNLSKKSYKYVGHFISYLGTYNDAIVLYAPIGAPMMIKYKVIAGYKFLFSALIEPDVFKNEEQLTLSEAYNQGWLTKRDIRDVRYYLNGI